MSGAGATSGTGRAFLTDFGLARDTATGSRFTRTGTTLGTPAYMPPEQARGELAALSPASDVWALGCVLFEAVTGRRAFEGVSAVDVVAAVLTREPPRLRALRPDAPAGVERLVRACLTKSATVRPANAEGLRDDCRRVLAGALPVARPPDQRRRLVAAAVLVVVGALGAGGFLAGSNRAPAQPPVSQAMAQAEALARQAHTLRQSDPREAALLLGEALALSEREAPADEMGRAAWRLERGLLLWAVGEGPAAREEWSRILPGAQEATRARLYRGLEAFFRLATDEARADLLDCANGAGLEARLARGAVAAGQRQWAAARAALDGIDGWEAALLLGYVENTDPAGDRVAGARAYDDALAEGITPAWALNNAGLARAAQGDYVGAIASYGRALAVDPRLAAAYYNRGHARQAQGNLTEALADFDRAVALSPRDADAFSSRGSVRHAQGDLGAAITEYGRALALRPRHPKALTNRGLARAALGDDTGAITDYDQAVAANPDLAETYSNRGISRAALGDLAGALADHNRALELNPRLAAAYGERGFVRAAQGELAGALADYEQAIELNPRYATAFYNRGNLRRAQGDLAAAIADYDRALIADERFERAYNNRAVARQQQGDLAGAVADYDRALALNPRNAGAYNNRGLAREAKDDLAGACADYQQALAVASPDWPGRRTAEENLARARAALAARGG